MVNHAAQHVTTGGHGTKQYRGRRGITIGIWHLPVLRRPPQQDRRQATGLRESLCSHRQLILEMLRVLTTST